MAFTAGNPIVQSGSDANLAANAGSVAADSLLATTGGQPFRAFRFDNRLNVTGSLTIDGFSENLVVNHADSTSGSQSVSITVSSGGTLTLNGATASIGSYTGDFDPFPVVILTKRAWFGFSSADSAINVNSGGALNANNVTLNCTGSVLVQGALNLSDCVFYIRNDLRGQPCAFQLNGASGSISNLKIYNGRLEFLGPYSGTISGFIPVFNSAVLAIQFSSGFTGSYTFRNYNNTFAPNGRVRFGAQQVVELRNCVNGSNVPITYFITGSVSNGESVTVTQDLILTAPNIRFFARDYNNGNRQNVTGFGVGAIDFVNDRVYTSLGNATHTMLLRVCRYPGANDTLATDDFRTKGGTDADLFDALYARYDATPIVETHALKGADGLAYTPSLTIDPFITRSTASAATAANTGLTSTGLGLLYDLSKVQKEAVGATPATDINPCEYPTLGTLYCSTSLGVELLINANVAISTASTAVSFNHSTNTISCPPLSTEGTFRTANIGNKTISFAQEGTYSAVPVAVGATGKVQVVGGETYLTGWTFTNGATIENTSVSLATVFVTAAEISKITASSANGGVTIRPTPPFINVRNFENGSKVTIVFGGQPIDVATTNAPYSYRFMGVVPATVMVQVEKSGFNTFTQDVPLEFADVDVFVSMPAQQDDDAIDSPDVKFRALFVADAAVKSILSQAQASTVLRQQCGRVGVFDFEVLDWKNGWNAIVDSVGTPPTLTDVNRWRSYATETGYGILFKNDPIGEVV